MIMKNDKQVHKWKHTMELTNKHNTINIKTDYQNN